MAANNPPTTATTLETMTEIRREARLRSSLKRRGYLLRKDRTWTTNLDHQGGYMIVDAYRNYIVDGSRFDMSLDDVAQFLKGGE